MFKRDDSLDGRLRPRSLIHPASGLGPPIFLNVWEQITIQNGLKRATLQATIVPFFDSYLVTITGGPPLTRKSLTRFPLPRILAYVRVSGGISVSRGPQYSPTNTNFM